MVHRYAMWAQDENFPDSIPGFIIETDLSVCREYSIALVLLVLYEEFPSLRPGAIVSFKIIAIIINHYPF